MSNKANKDNEVPVGITRQMKFYKSSATCLHLPVTAGICQRLPNYWRLLRDRFGNSPRFPEEIPNQTRRGLEHEPVVDSMIFCQA